MSISDSMHYDYLAKETESRRCLGPVRMNTRIGKLQQLWAFQYFDSAGCPTHGGEKWVDIPETEE